MKGAGREFVILKGVPYEVVRHANGDQTTEELYPRSWFNDYQKWALTKDRKDYSDVVARLADSKKLQQLMHASIGVCGEAGELMDTVKKSLMYGKPIDFVNIREELGDILWYLSLAIEAAETSFAQVMKENYEKLEKRYPSEQGGYSDKFAADRMDKNDPSKG